MGGGAADERQTRQEMASLPIPDEILEEILLRLPTPADLVRASAACVSFRRVTAGRSLIRRFRKLHAPPLLGFVEQRKVFHPATQPYPSASAAKAFAKAADFSFSFLPAPARSWVVQDIRDGRVLLDRFRRRGTKIFPELVVCDPLHRRYLRLPPIPEDLAASVEDPFLISQKRLRVETFLVPTGHSEEAGAEDDTSFRVIWMAQCITRLVTFVFSSNTRRWQAVPSRRWIDLSADLPQLTKSRDRFYLPNYVCGCFYWRTRSKERKLLVLDIKTMEFFIAKPPPEANDCCNFVMVDAGGGRPGMLVHEDSGSNLSYFIRQNDGGSSSQWQKVKTISLDSWVYLICNMEKYPLVYLGQGETTLLGASCFTLDIETFQLEKVCAVGSDHIYGLCAYRNFPPSLLSPPTISSGVENKAEKEMLKQCCAASSSAEPPRSG